MLDEFDDARDAALQARSEGDFNEELVHLRAATSLADQILHVL